MSHRLQVEIGKSTDSDLDFDLYELRRWLRLAKRHFQYIAKREYHWLHYSLVWRVFGSVTKRVVFRWELRKIRKEFG